MGEVYRARDTRLERTVAVKILPDHLSDRAELRERFEREARTVASLNHPHICTLHNIGHQDGIDYLVLEMVGPCGLEPQTSTVSILSAVWEQMRSSEHKLHCCSLLTEFRTEDCCIQLQRICAV
jgi:serine/threonine protein kinase